MSKLDPLYTGNLDKRTNFFFLFVDNGFFNRNNTLAKRDTKHIQVLYYGI
jgi:hypothetical protein